MNDINCGVPHGSVLCPLLFIIYINDLPNISNLFNPIIFVDDRTLILSEKSLINLKNIMQVEINKLYTRLNVNELSLNIDKTNVLLFNIRNKNIHLNLNLALNNKPINQISHIIF